MGGKGDDEGQRAMGDGPALGAWCLVPSCRAPGGDGMHICKSMLKSDSLSSFVVDATRTAGRLRRFVLDCSADHQKKSKRLLACSCQQRPGIPNATNPYPSGQNPWTPLMRMHPQSSFGSGCWQPDWWAACEKVELDVPAQPRGTAGATVGWRHLAHGERGPNPAGGHAGLSGTDSHRPAD